MQDIRMSEWGDEHDGREYRKGHLSMNAIEMEKDMNVMNSALTVSQRVAIIFKPLIRAFTLRAMFAWRGNSPMPPISPRDS
jgi:hypothetical protein